MTTSNQVGSLYRTVVDDVLNNVKEAFLDDGVDEQVLQELRQLWEGKLIATKVLDPPTEPEVHLTNPNLGLLMQEHLSQQNVHQGYIPRAVLASAQHQSQTIPVTITTHQAELSGAAAQATMALPMGLFQQQFALGAGNVTLATANGQYIAVQNVGGQPTFTIPQQLVQQAPMQTTQQMVTSIQGNPAQSVIQLDGIGDGSSSSEDEDFDNDDNDDDAEEEVNEDDADQGEEEEPLNSADDVSEEDPNELFDSENVVVCQYDKINRNKNKWKFHLKDGIMNLNGRDYVFQRANGDAEW